MTDDSRLISDADLYRLRARQDKLAESDLWEWIDRLLEHIEAVDEAVREGWWGEA